jgi:hypothetical protein
VKKKLKKSTWEGKLRICIGHDEFERLQVPYSVYMINILNILGEFLPGRVSCENAQPKMSSRAIPPTTEEAGPRMRIRRIIFREKYMATAVYVIMKICE